MNKDCCIFIAARDSYADTWDLFFSLFFKYWPDCPFPVYLISENKKYYDSRVISVSVAENLQEPWGEQWSFRMKEALDKINVPYFIFFHTDYLLTEKVDTKRILNLLEIVRRDDVGCVRLYPCPPPTYSWKEEDGILGVINKSDNYSVSLQATLWKRDIFEKILKDGWGPVEMELYGGRESIKIPQLFLSVFKKDPAISYINGIKKGMWLFDAVRFMQREGFSFVSMRPIESIGAYYMRMSGFSSFFSRLRRMTLKKLILYCNKKINKVYQ